MSFQMTHMQIAYNLIDIFGINEGKEEFILGSVAPDAVHFRDDFVITEKVHSHIFEGCGPWGDTQDYKKWITNIEAFKSQYVETEQEIRFKAFKLGMCVHCITDYCNDVYIWRNLQRKFIPPMTIEEFKSEYYPEALSVDKWLFQNSTDTIEILEMLKKAQCYEIEDYTHVDDLLKLKDNLLNNQYNLDRKIDVSGYKYYPADKILWFVDTVTEKIACNEFLFIKD